MHGLKWTRKTTRNIARQLRRLDIPISAGTVGRLLKDMGFSLRVNHKTLESGNKNPEFAEVDFGQLGLMQELGSGRRRVVHGFMMVLGYSHDPAQGTVRCLDQRRLSALFRLGRRAWERAGLKSIYHTGSRLQIRDTSNTFKGRYKQRLNKPTIKSSREVRNEHISRRRGGKTLQ